MEYNVAQHINPAPFVDSQIDDLKVQCPMSIENEISQNGIANHNVENQEDKKDEEKQSGDEENQNGDEENQNGDEQYENDDKERESMINMEEQALISGHKRKKLFADMTRTKKRKITNMVCNWQGTYGDWKKKHQENCEFKIIECCYCSEFGETYKTTRRRMKEHHEKCQFYPIQCPQCNDAIQRGNLDEHLKEICDEGIVLCNDCEEEFMREDEFEHEESCPNKEMTCRYHKYGCVVTFQRHEQDIHETGAAKEHIYMLKQKIDELQTHNMCIIEHIKEFQKYIPLLRNISPSNTISE